MKKLKIYLDTSVISHLQGSDVPEKMDITLKLWSEIQAGFYEVVISEVVLSEIADCKEPKKSELMECLQSIEFEKIKLDEEITELARKYIEEGILLPKCIDDALHIAAASVTGCNAIVSWNFKHIVKLRTFIGVNGINKLMGYGEIALVPPNEVINEEE